MNTFFKSLLVCAALVSTMAHAFPNPSTKNGWPLPWPFPFASECPVDWKNFGGIYQISDSNQSERLIVKISVLTKKGIRLVRVSRYSAYGRLMFDGTAFVTEKQKVISMYLHGVNEFASAEPVWAVIKMHYDSSVFSCAAEHLVPILTVQVHDQSGPLTGIDYRMTRVD